MSQDQHVYACTLTPETAAGRLDDDHALASRVVATERTAAGLRVKVEGGPEGRRLVDTFVANERRCCGFFDFAVTEADGLVTLEITAPPRDDAQLLVDAAKQTFELRPDAILSTGTIRYGDG